MIMENQPDERSTAELFSEYANLLWRWSWLLILLALIAGGTAYLLSKRGTPIYQSSSLMMINLAPASQPDPYSSLFLSQQLTTTYAQIMTTRQVLNAVAKKLGLESIPASIQVKTIQNTSLLRVVVQDTDPDRAALIANTIVSVFSDQIQADQASRYLDSKKSFESQMTLVDQQIKDTTNSLTMLNEKIQETTDAIATVNQQIQDDTKNLAMPETIQADKSRSDQLGATLVQYQSERERLETTLGQYQQSYDNLMQSYEQVKLAETQSTSTIVQKDPAVPQRSPIQPQPMQSALLAAVVGFIIAAGIIFLIEFLDDTIRDPQDITRRWGIPVLGMIVSFKSSNGDSLITVKHPRSPVSEAFRSLRTNLQFASVDTPLHTLLVTSPSPEDGKTTIVANLASVIAQSGRDVVIVDADLRRPRIHKIFQLSNRAGLTDQFIQTQDHFDGSLKSTEIANLHAVTSGNLPPNPSELLSSGRMFEILRQLSDQFNTVIIDSPPALIVTDALALAPRVDGVLLVVKPSITKRAALKQVIEQLQQVKANLLGVIVNDVKVNRSRYYYYRGYYYSRKYSKGYHYSENDSEQVTDPASAIPDGHVSRLSLLPDSKEKGEKKRK